MANESPIEPQLALILEAWKITIGTQQHFNDIALRIRTAAITVLTAVIAAAGYALDKQERLVWPQFGSPPVTPFILLAGLFAWLAFFFMDKYWYHQLLIGSVKHGESLERLSGHLDVLGLTHAISTASAVKIGPKPQPGDFDRRLVVHSNVRMNIFYYGIAALIVILAIGSFFIAAPAIVPTS